MRNGTQVNRRTTSVPLLGVPGMQSRIVVSDWWVAEGWTDPAKEAPRFHSFVAPNPSPPRFHNIP